MGSRPTSTGRAGSGARPPLQASAGRPMRADARRNYDRLLTVARAAFLERGTDVPLEDIAKTAGVGIGTLYRHFPTRTDLMEAVFLDNVEDLERHADRLLDSPDVGAAITEWLRALIAFSNDFRGLSRSLLLADEGSYAATKKGCHQILVDAAHALIERAQQEGIIRADVSPSMVLKLANGIAVATEHAEPADAERMFATMMDGLRHTTGGAHNQR
jgi:AcrR family transcriptional regulator